MKKFVSALLILILTAALAAPSFALPAPELELSAASAIVINLDTGTVVYSKNADEQRAMASMTKMMTALVAYDMCAGDLKNTAVKVPYNIWDYFAGYAGISTCGIVAGETLSMYDILHGLLIPSGNEAATSIACFYGYDTFIEAMNSKAAALGMTGTHFANPHGLDGTNHYSNASDIAKLAAEFIKNSALYEIVCKVTYQLPDAPNGDKRVLYTTNLCMIESSGYYYSPVRGIKTGYTNSAGHCLASTAVYGGVRYLAVLMGCDYNAVFSETDALYKWCFSSLKYVSPIDENTTVSSVKVKCAAKTDSLIVYPEQPLYGLFGADEQIEVTYELELPETVEAPIAVGQVIGKAKVYYSGVLAGEVNLISREEIKRSAFVAVMDAIKTAVLSLPGRIIIGALFLIFMAYIYYVKIVIPRAARKKKYRKK